jgi:hypothetical protein
MSSQLGIAARAKFQRNTLAFRSYIKRPPQEGSVGTVGIGFSILGFVTGISTAAIKTENGLKRAKEEAKALNYMQVFDTSEKEPVILNDTESGNERAWMVSQLCLIFELFNFWAFKTRFRIPSILTRAQTVVRKQGTFLPMNSMQSEL